MNQTQDFTLFRLALRRGLPNFRFRERRALRRALDDRSESLEVLHMMAADMMDTTPPPADVDDGPDRPIMDFAEMLLDRLAEWIKWVVDNADAIARALAMLVAVFV